MKKLYKKYFGEFLVALGAISYSFEWYFIRKLDTAGYSSYDITFIKLFICAIIILFFSIFIKKNKTDKNKFKTKDYIILFLLGIFSIIGNILFNEAIVITSISNVLIIVYLSVFWSIILGIFILKEKYNIKQLLYAFLAFIGIVFVLLKDIKTLSFDLGLGELYAFLLSIVFSISVLITKQMSHFGIYYRLFIIFMVSSVILFTYIIFNNGIYYLYNFINKDFLFYGGLLAITAGIMGRGLKDIGLKYVPSGIVMIILLLEPIGQIITGYFIDGETLMPINILGIFLVFLGVIKISKK